MSQFVYDLVTSHIVSALSRGVVPWRKPWRGSTFAPMNLASKRPYSGINVFLLGIAPFEDNRWVTFRQAEELGGNVKRGEKSSIAVFYKHLERERQEKEDGQIRRFSVPLLRFYHLFNVEQCEGIRVPPVQVPSAPSPKRVEDADAIATKMPDPPRISISHQGAWYRPSDDLIGVPPLRSFTSSDAYYGTLFHELGHSTGHEKRLNRAGVTGTIQFGSEMYSHEELVAELTSAYLCSILGLDNSLIENSASYIAGWLGALKNDKKAIIIASSQAQKAANFIRGIIPQLSAEP